jgi:hypothetical protein
VRENLMHGLTGGSWKRSGHSATAAEKNNPTGNRAVHSGSATYHRITPPRQLSTLLRYGNSAHAFGKIRKYALMRLALFVAKRHQRGRAWGFNQLTGAPFCGR